jgi:hypothetical protein
VSVTDRAKSVNQCNTFVTDRDGCARNVTKGSRIARLPLEKPRDIPDANGGGAVLAWEPDGAAFGGAVDSPNQKESPDGDRHLPRCTARGARRRGPLTDGGVAEATARLPTQGRARADGVLHRHPTERPLGDDEPGQQVDEERP